MAALAALAASTAAAQEMEPRLYSNAPVGMNFLIAAYAHSDGGVATDPAVPLTNAHVTGDLAILGYARVLDLWGKSGKFDAVLPYACLAGSAEYLDEARSRDLCAMADPRFRLSVNLYGAPALSLKEFAGYRQDVIVGASVQVSAPLGRYDSDRLLNTGTNRWFVRPEIGVSKALGPLTLELATSATFFTDNDDFMNGGHKEQDPLYLVQGHAVYAFANGVWTALDAAWVRGGRTTLDGVLANDLQDYWRFGLTIALPVDRYNSVKLYGSSGMATQFGGDFDLIGIAWQHRWGAGL